MPPDNATTRSTRLDSAGTTRWSRRSLLLSGAGVAAGVAATSAIASGIAAASATTAPSAAGFASADEAMSAYLNSLAAADFDGAVAAFAIEPYVEHFDFGAAIERLRSYVPASGAMPLPSSNAFNIAINVESRRTEVVGQILGQYFALVNPQFDRLRAQPLDVPGSVDEFVASMEATMTPDSLADLGTHEFLSLEQVESEVAARYAEDSAAQQEEAQRVIYGADEFAQLAARSSVGGGDVIVLMRAARYGDAWWLDTPTSIFVALLGLPFHKAGVFWPSALAAGSSVPTGSAPIDTAT